VTLLRASCSINPLRASCNESSKGLMVVTPLRASCSINPIYYMKPLKEFLQEALRGFTT
jgi:hypothetical protein